MYEGGKGLKDIFKDSITPQHNREKPSGTVARCVKTLEAPPGQSAVLLLQVRVILSGGMNPVSPNVLRATLPFGRITK